MILLSLINMIGGGEYVPFGLTQKLYAAAADVPSVPSARLSQMPPMAALAVFKKADCSSGEIEALRAHRDIDPEKMRKVEEYALIMENIIKTAPNGGVISGQEFVVMNSLVQACPLPEQRSTLMLKFELMKLYSDLLKKVSTDS